MADVRVWSWDRAPYSDSYDEVVVSMSVFGNELTVHVVLDEDEKVVDARVEYVCEEG